MESLRDKLLNVIAGGIPNTPENIEFCENGEEGGFIEMLDRVMDTIAEHIIEALSDEIK